MRKLAIFVLLLGELVLAGAVAAQDPPGPPESNTVSCNFADDKQVTVRYNSIPYNKKERLRENKIWMPGGAAMILFTGADLKFGEKNISAGAYTMYLIPAKKNWTLIVSKNEKPESAYNPQQDLARGQMDLGQLSQPAEKLTLYFGQMGPKQCNLRVYYGNTGAFTEFYEQ
jgi:hypothetical protein